MKTFPVIVTAADLDAAVDMKKTAAEFDQCGSCVMAQALKRSVGFGVRATYGLSSATVGELQLHVPDAAQDLIALFDNEAYDVIRGLLPVTLTFEVVQP